MGKAELFDSTNELVITSVFYFYGDASTPELSASIAADTTRHWNEPAASVVIRKKTYSLRFVIKGIHAPDLKPDTVWYNDDPALNFFRIEHFANGNISFVDAIGSNTGYFKLDNLLQTSTTAAHEYGHSLGLIHPKILDIRGGLEPAIMYPRGTLCDAHLQYDPTAKPLEQGGFLDPRHRRVCLQDIIGLRLHRLDFDDNGTAVVGGFTSIFHERHQPVS